MKTADAWITVSLLVRDTFRQSLASGICWLLFALSTICIVVCLSASVSGPAALGPPGLNPDFLPRHDPDAGDPRKLEQSGVTVADGSLRLAFGAIQLPVARDTRSAVHFLQLLLAGGVADTLGLLLTLVWTAGFLPSFLDPRAASVLLAKPIPRWGLLCGKYLGVLTFVLLHASYFVVGTWLALAAQTGIWDAGYLLSVPLLLMHFAIFFSFSLLLAVCFRSTVVCVFGSIAFWGICWGMNFGRNMVAAMSAASEAKVFSPVVRWLADAGYWVLPKPVDLGRLVFDALGGGSHFRPLLDNGASVSLGLSVLTSLLFTGYVLVAASRHFARMDY